jgi:DNA-binding transcriptional ArsR family regulator
MKKSGTICFNQDKVLRLKSQLDLKQTESRAERFKALGHAKRLAVFELLNNEELCVCDMAHIFDLPVSTLSQYLRILKTAGLIHSRQEGKFLYYSAIEEMSDCPIIKKESCCND